MLGVLISDMVFLERLFVENKVVTDLLWSAVEEGRRIVWVDAGEHWGNSGLVGWLSVELFLRSLDRLDLDLDKDMNASLGVMIWMNLVKQSWLMVDEKEMDVLSIADRVDVVGDKFSLNRSVVVIISLEDKR